VTHDIGALLDAGRTGGYQRWLVCLTALTIVFDGIDNQLLGVVIPTVMKEWDVARSAFAPVVSLGLAGMMAGGALAGLAGDRFGRRTALLGSMAVFGGVTLATAAVRDLSSLAALRFLAGIGLGGALPNAATLAAEFVPRAHRPMAVTATIVCVPLGGMLAGVLGSLWLETLGWRALFVAGGVIPLLAAVALARVLPESPRFLARHPNRWPELVRLLGRFGHALPPDATFSDSGRIAARAPISTLLSAGFRRDTIALWVSFSSCLLAVYLGFSWLPTVLAGGGFGPGVASNGITAFNLGGVVGAIASGVVMSRIGSRTAMLAMNAGAIAGAGTLSLMTISVDAALAPIMIMLTLTGGLINAIQTTMYALATNVYPTAVRAGGVGAATAIGRTGAIMSGYAGPLALAAGGSASYFGLIAAAMGVCLAALASVRRHIPRAAVRT
jgi:AAHS family 4-hydroxybenzoate transporter-like MFS transporter